MISSYNIYSILKKGISQPNFDLKPTLEVTSNERYFLEFEKNFQNIFQYPLADFNLNFRLLNVTLSNSEYLNSFSLQNVTCQFKNENKNETQLSNYYFNSGINSNGFCKISLNSTGQFDLTLWYNGIQLTTNSIPIHSIRNLILIYY